MTKPIAAHTFVLAATIAAASSGWSLRASAQNPISNADAERIATREVPNGHVVEIERDSERGRDVVEVTVRDGNGVEHELTIDARTGEVIRREIDHDD